MTLGVMVKRGIQCDCTAQLFHSSDIHILHACSNIGLQTLLVKEPSVKHCMTCSFALTAFGGHDRTTPFRISMFRRPGGWPECSVLLLFRVPLTPSRLRCCVCVCVCVCMCLCMCVCVHVCVCVCVCVFVHVCVCV